MALRPKPVPMRRRPTMARPGIPTPRPGMAQPATRNGCETAPPDARHGLWKIGWLAWNGTARDSEWPLNRPTPNRRPRRVHLPPPLPSSPFRTSVVSLVFHALALPFAGLRPATFPMTCRSSPEGYLGSPRSLSPLFLARPFFHPWPPPLLRLAFLDPRRRASSTFFDPP